MLVRDYEMPWRPAYEMWAGAAWLVGLLFFVYLGGRGLHHHLRSRSAWRCWR